jgi:acyl-CoA thioesterase-1
MSQRASIAVAAVILLASCGGGSGSSGPSQVPAGATNSLTALVFYDENHDGVLGGEERVRLPGVQLLAGSQTGTSDATGRVTIAGLGSGALGLSVQVASLPAYFEPGRLPAVTLPVAEGTVVPVPLTLAIGGNQPNQFLAFGDSITDGAGSRGREGWATPLERRLQAHWGVAEVVVDGIYGSRSIDGVERLPAVLARNRPAFVLVLYGTNDWTRCQFTTPEACYTVPALREMLRTIRAVGALPVVGTIIPVNPAFPELKAADRNEWVRLENELIRPMVQQEGAVLADSFAAFGSSQSLWPDLFFDQAHPNDDGHARIADAFFQAITRSRGGR